MNTGLNVEPDLK